ncbi:MAG: dihydrofolate reductase, partial [Dysgonamonadaceae bacterium]|nr:dihydrofolate reductase [Dysgonamonadaceae bacterium]
MKISIIVAAGKNNEIGQGGRLLCHLPVDLRRFKAITTGHAVIMGRRTFDSLPGGALPNRRNIIISRNPELKPEGAETASSLDTALIRLINMEEIFIIGGAQIYRQVIEQADRIYLTRIHATFPQADAYFPEIDKTQWREAGRETIPAD